MSDVTWRRLGELLVDKHLLTEGGLERALTEQRRSGRMLGEILIERGWISPSELAAALGEQHGIEVAPQAVVTVGELTRSAAQKEEGGKTPWRPLGRILVDRGALGELTLQAALREQRETGRKLGELLVERNIVTARDIAEALAEQQGVPMTIADEVDARLIAQDESTDVAGLFELCRIEDGVRTIVHRAESFLDATDHAFELIDAEDPQALEIVSHDGERSAVAWQYTRERAEAAARESQSVEQIFGFNPNSWDHPAVRISKQIAESKAATDRIRDRFTRRSRRWG